MHKKTTAVSVLLTLSIGAFAADYYVAPNGTGDYSYGNPGPTPWGAAEKATQAGDVIHIAAGTYSYTTDILGHARIFKHAKVPGQPRTVDIGAFECQWKPGLLLMFR